MSSTNFQSFVICISQFIQLQWNSRSVLLYSVHLLDKGCKWAAYLWFQNAPNLCWFRHFWTTLGVCYALAMSVSVASMCIRSVEMRPFASTSQFCSNWRLLGGHFFYAGWLSAMMWMMFMCMCGLAYIFHMIYFMLKLFISWCRGRYFLIICVKSKWFNENECVE